MKLLCWIGIHSWIEVLRLTMDADTRFEVDKVTYRCKRCRRYIDQYDTKD